MVLPQDNSSSFKLDEPSTCTHSTSHTNISPNHENDFMLYPTLDYINRFLLEENIDEQFITGYQEAVALSHIEKPFYDVLGEEYPPSSNYHFTLSPSMIPSSVSTHLTQDSKIETLMAEGFQRGVEEGMKFLPISNNLAIDFHVSRLSLDMTHRNNNKSPETNLGEDNAHDLLDRCKTTKSSSNTQMDPLEGRNSKMPVLSTEETIRDEMFDKVLLYHGEEYAREEVSRLREIMKSSASHHSKNKENQEDNIDVTSLLIQCSEAVAFYNSKVVKELLNEIRKQASPVGNGAQRLACILADGLEARLAGTGSEAYRRLIRRRISTREILKAYHMYITASPFLRISYSFANDYICKVAENASKMHIIDLGITFGFQWPPLIQALSKKRGSDLELRITGVDLPQPGFRPTERIRQIGARLEEYAKSFGVIFKYQYIASPWESICIDDLNIDEEEVLVVNSMFRFKQVRDDNTYPTDSPRNQVLNFIRQIRPKVLILGTFSVSFSPFFTTRFRKVLLHYSMLFDMFDVLVPRNDEGRQLMERELLAPPIINLVACEGHNWVERPETYKQWHKRISQAGFDQLPIDRDTVKDCDEKVKSGYHEGFFLEEESGWLLQGWRGRINYALSMWEPKLH